MNFDQDYREFVEYLEKTCVLRPIKIDKIEDNAVQLFVTYLNIRYAKTHLTPDAADNEGRGNKDIDKTLRDMCKM